MSVWAFDIDGVLVDTRALVFEAYEEAGCPMPPDKFGVLWSKWMPEACGSYEAAVRIHDLKTDIYLDKVAAGQVKCLPGADMARALRQAGHRVFAVTSASLDAALTSLDAAGLERNLLLGYALNPAGRVRIMEQIRRGRPKGEQHTYVDDRIEGKELAVAAGYGFTHAQWGNT